jgi:hypothetical protein
MTTYFKKDGWMIELKGMVKEASLQMISALKVHEVLRRQFITTLTNSYL